MNRPASTRMREIWRTFHQLPAGAVVKTKDLAAQFNVSTKTIYRDLEELQNWGLITVTNRDGINVQGHKAVKVVCPFCSELQPIQSQ